VNIGYSGIGVVGVLFNSWMGVVELEIVGVLFSSCVGVGVLEVDWTVSMSIGIFNTSPSLGLNLQQKENYFSRQVPNFLILYYLT